MDQSSNEINEIKIESKPAKLPQSFWNFNDKNAAEIQREIQVTRADLDDTVNALQERLAPQQYINHALDLARDTLREASPKIAQAVRNNPLPTALIALGVGWLYLRATSPPRYQAYGAVDESEYALTRGGQRVQGAVSEGMNKAKGAIQSTAAEVKDWASEKTGQFKEGTSKLAGQAREKAGQLTDQAMEKAGQWADNAKEAVGHLAGSTREKAGEIAGATWEKAGQVAHQARIQATHLGDYTRDQLSHAGESTSKLFQENPLAFAAIGLGIGAAIGLSLPLTQQEREVMGKASDQVVSSAKEAGEQTMAKVAQVVQAGQESMQDEARREDLI